MALRVEGGWLRKAATWSVEGTLSQAAVGRCLISLQCISKLIITRYSFKYSTIRPEPCDNSIFIIPYHLEDIFIFRNHKQLQHRFTEGKNTLEHWLLHHET